MSAKIQVVFYSMYGHIHKMAEAISEEPEGGAEVAPHQVAELMSDDQLEKAGAKAARTAFAHPFAQPDQLADADPVIFGAPTRYGNMCAQMRNFLDQTVACG
jgi:NAD(P)H dehydrogenase (quinone)